MKEDWPCWNTQVRNCLCDIFSVFCACPLRVAFLLQSQSSTHRINADTQRTQCEACQYLFIHSLVRASIHSIFHSLLSSLFFSPICLQVYCSCFNLFPLSTLTLFKRATQNTCRESGWVWSLPVWILPRSTRAQSSASSRIVSTAAKSNGGRDGDADAVLFGDNHDNRVRRPMKGSIHRRSNLLHLCYSSPASLPSSLTPP